MNLKAGLFQQQTLKLTMTQDLSQAIALLQYSTLDLAAFLETKAAENPLISLESRTYEKGERKRKIKKHSLSSDSENWIEQIGYESHSLEDYLFSQLNLHSVTDKQRKILKILIRNLDKNGYLRIDMEELKQQCKEPEDQIEEALSMLQHLEPAGVAARDLRECLLLQIARTECPDYTLEVIRDFFIYFADKKWRMISNKLNITMNEIQQISDFIQTLNPRPCSDFSTEKAAFIHPDVIVELIEGALVVRMADDPFANMTLNEVYYKQMKLHGDKQVNQFLTDKYQEFQWVVRGVQQRRETIFKVMTKIVEKQRECMLKGLNYLQPMTMREVADELDIHESTVSRTVRDKYVQAPFGTAELRAFFSSGLQSTDYEEVSAMEAKWTIQSLIKEEDKKKPLSDQEISNILKEQNSIILSRRTVAKYREQLKIPSSSKRKRF